MKMVLPMQRYITKLEPKNEFGDIMDDSRYDKQNEGDINPLVAPCGGWKKYRTHMEADSGTPLEVAWAVHSPDVAGNCTLSLNDGIEDDEGLHTFDPLIPTHSFDGDIEKQKKARINLGIHKAATFPCGRRVAALEGALFHLPKNMSCDSCVLQMTWETKSVGKMYMCSDIEITNGVKEDCSG